MDFFYLFFLTFGDLLAVASVIPQTPLSALNLTRPCVVAEGQSGFRPKEANNNVTKRKEGCWVTAVQQSAAIHLRAPMEMHFHFFAG